VEEAVTIVALGGGTGLPAVLTGLRRYLPASSRITASHGGYGFSLVLSLIVSLDAGCLPGT